MPVPSIAASAVRFTTARVSNTRRRLFPPMPVVFGPTLRRIATARDDSKSADGSESRDEAARRTPRPPRKVVTPRRVALGVAVAGAAAWVAARRLRSDDGDSVGPHAAGERQTE